MNLNAIRSFRMNSFRSSTPTLADWIGCPEKLLRLLLEYGLVINLALPWLSPYLGSYYDWAADHWAEESCESCPPTAISYFLSLSTPCMVRCCEIWIEWRI